jgi:hypothetical protein
LTQFSDDLYNESLEFSITTESNTLPGSLENFELDAALDSILEAVITNQTPYQQDHLSELLRPLTRTERAEQVALEVVQRHDWVDGLHVLQRAFSMAGTGQARIAIENLIELGATPDEIELALELRAVWRDSPEFGVNLVRPLGTSSGRPYAVMSWSLALGLVRGFRAIPDREEVVGCLHHLFAFWRDYTNLLKRFPAFQLFLHHVVNDLPEHDLDQWLHAATHQAAFGWRDFE